jgi:CBS domain-containing protein
MLSFKQPNNMGEQKVSLVSDGEQMQKFVKNLLQDVEALEYMLEHDWFETDTMRIGAEQELCLVDKKTLKPATIAMEVLEHMKDHDWVETELASFNLETNLMPRVFTGDCLSQMEKETQSNLQIISKQLKHHHAELILTGILPTLRKFDLDMSNLTPKKRYKALMEAINSQLIGSAYELRLSGIDELLLKHQSPLLEACNTSFQVHLQVKPSDFVKLYNITQALTGPIIAISANSPLVFGKRLWHESRIALFQQALDTRTTQEHMRDRSPRVNFGSDWLDQSILEIYKEDIARFRVLLSADVEEDSLELIQNKKVPKLRALQVHNSTVYRWNRPCYGISENGKPHLRIENRVLPAGPTVVDEIANAAFWLGAVEGMALECEDIRKKMSWDDARDNFAKAAQFGIDSEFTWFNDKKISACDLILNELLPIARKGLEHKKVKQADIDKYLGIIEGRAKEHMNGARWQLRAFSKLIKEVDRDEALSVLTSSIIKNQAKSKPVHTWKLPKTNDLDDYSPSKLKIEEFMETDLFTVQKDDIIELVTELMEWRKLRYVPVEDSKGNLIGLITRRLLLRYFSRKNRNLKNQQEEVIKDIMIKEPITISPSATILDAISIMRDNRIGCLPVVQENELVGVITEMDFVRISSRLIERLESK